MAFGNANDAAHARASAEGARDLVRRSKPKAGTGAAWSGSRERGAPRSGAVRTARFSLLAIALNRTNMDFLWFLDLLDELSLSPLNLIFPFFGCTRK